MAAAVVGMGGVGKTELAIQYARQHLNDTYKGGVCFISGGSFIFEVIQFARPRFFPKMDFTGFLEAEQLAYCWQHWAEGEVLLIVDDVIGYKQQVKPYLPGDPRFKILITTREQIPNVTPLNLEVLHPDDALKLLESIIGTERVQAEPETAQQLCEWLGYLPLGLELVGKYLAEDEVLSLAEMQKRLQRKRLKHRSLGDAEAAVTAKLGVAAAFELSWERLQQQPETQRLGCLLSLFYPDEMLWELVEIVYQFWQGEEIDLEDVEDGRRQLVKLSLLKRTEQKTYRLHRLLREFFRDKLEEQEAATAMKQAFVTTMVKIADEIPHNMTTQQVKQVEPAIKHIEEVANSFTELLSNEDLVTPFTRVAWFYQSQTLYSQAEPWLKKSLERAKTRFGDEHNDVATSLNNLASLYESQGRYSEAEPLYQQALEMRQRLFEGDHPSVASSLNNLAYLYESQGRNSEAEPLLQQALAMTQRLFEGDHPYVASSLNNLASLYQSQGRNSEAEPLLQQALAMRQRLFEGDHPSVASSLNNLAYLYESQGRNSEAEPLLQQALEMYQRLFEGDHPHLASSLNNLGLLYDSQGRYSEAEPLYQQALAMTQRLFEGDHPDVASSLNNLAYLYKSQGRYSEAEPLYQQALEMYQRLFEGDHPNVALSLNNLAGLYQSQGRNSEAEPLLQQALEMYQRLFEGDHPHLASSLNNLAYLYQSQGRYSEAEPLYQQALAMTQRLFEGDHPDVATSLNNLASLYDSQGRNNEAEPLYLQALEMRQRLFQGDHPDVASSLNNLALLYHSQGRNSEAEPLYQQALEMFERTLGVGHRDTITVRGNYADCLRKLTATQKNNQSQSENSSSFEDILQQMQAIIDRSL
uniref:tetratricopeptide repeat protein n=1 Tax=Limnoraphis robusta TaxID=1118279 RepID=UPI0038991286